MHDSLGISLFCFRPLFVWHAGSVDQVPRKSYINMHKEHKQKRTRAAPKPTSNYIKARGFGTLSLLRGWIILAREQCFPRLQYRASTVPFCFPFFLAQNLFRLSLLPRSPDGHERSLGPTTLPNLFCPPPLLSPTQSSSRSKSRGVGGRTSGAGRRVLAGGRQPGGALADAGLRTGGRRGDSSAGGLGRRRGHGGQLGAATRRALRMGTRVAALREGGGCAEGAAGRAVAACEPAVLGVHHPGTLSSTTNYASLLCCIIVPVWAFFLCISNSLDRTTHVRKHGCRRVRIWKFPFVSCLLICPKELRKNRRR